MALNAFGLGFNFTAKDSASPVIRGVGKSFQSMDRSTNRSAQRMQAAQGAMSVGLGAMAVGAGGLALAYKSAESSGKFEQGLAKVGQISNATAEELIQLKERAIEAGIETQFSPHEALEGLEQLTVRGIVAKDAMKALGGALDLAAGGQISIADASSTTASALNVFKMDADQATFAADKLLKISTVTALQAKDLELALGTVGRGATLAKQNIDEMLPSIGLVANTGVAASVAASATSSALLQMAKNASKFQEKLGVSVTDASGQFRPYMDVVLDTANAMSGMTNEAEKAAIAHDLFGRFGVTSFAAVSSQLANGIKTTTGEVVKGAEAIEYLRKTMRDAGGTAEEFRKALLDTLPGQLILLEGSIQTLGVVMGEELAASMKPVVAFFVDLTNRVISFVQDMSPEMKRIIGLVFLIGSALAAAGGAVLLFGAMATIAAPGIMMLGSAIAGASAPLLVIAALVAGAVALFLIFRQAYENNIGHFADFVGPLIDKVVLFFKGLFELITTGMITGDTAVALEQPENVGILKFLLALVKIKDRVMSFIEGVSAGWTAFMEKAEPAFHSLINALTKVDALFNEIMGSSESALGPSQKYVEWGEKIGTIFARVATFVITFLAIYIAVWVGMVKAMRKAFDIMSPFFETIIDSFDDIRTAITDLLVELGIMDPAVGASTDAWETFGMFLGGFYTMFIMPLVVGFRVLIGIIKFWVRILVAAVRFIANTFSGLIEIGEGVIAFFMGDWDTAWEKISSGFKKMWGGIGDFLGSVFDAMKEQVDDLLDLLAKIVMEIPAAYRPEGLTAFAESRIRTGPMAGGIGAALQQNIATKGEPLAIEAAETALSNFKGSFGGLFGGAAEASTTANKTAKSEIAQGLEAGLHSYASAMGHMPQKKQKLQIALQVDKETLGTALVDIEKEAAALGFGAEFPEE